MAINTVDFNTFEKVDLPAVDTTLYTTPASTKTALLSVVFSNKTGASVNVTVKIIRAVGPVTVVVVQSAPIPVGGALDVVLNKPIFLLTGDILKAAASAVSSIDVVGSVMETT